MIASVLIAVAVLIALAFWLRWRSGGTNAQRGNTRAQAANKAPRARAAITAASSCGIAATLAMRSNGSAQSASYQARHPQSPCRDATWPSVFAVMCTMTTAGTTTGATPSRNRRASRPSLRVESAAPRRTAAGPASPRIDQSQGDRHSLRWRQIGRVVLGAGNARIGIGAFRLPDRPLPPGMRVRTGRLE
jgi:hypothetical protein